jgi:hypothetical protein
LATELATDGYHAWNRLYRMISGEEEVTVDGQTFSLGQLMIPTEMCASEALNAMNQLGPNWPRAVPWHLITRPAFA